MLITDRYMYLYCMYTSYTIVKFKAIFICILAYLPSDQLLIQIVDSSPPQESVGLEVAPGL